MKPSRRVPRLRFRLPLDAARLLRARERVRDYLRTVCADDELVDDVVLCVEEACTNAIRHSQSGEDMAVSLAFDDGALVVDVRDKGVGFDVARFDPEATPDLMADGGRGLFLIASLMDQLDLSVNAGLHVHMVKRDIDESCAVTGFDSAVPHGRDTDSRQDRMRALLDEIDEAFIALDWEYRVVHANEAAGELAHLPPSDLLQRTPLQIWPELQDTDVDARLREAMELGRSSLLDWRSENGRWLEMRIYPTPSGVSGYVRDIAERKKAELAGEQLVGELRRSEERFRATFEHAAVGVVHIALDGRYDRVNERFCDLVGYRRAELERMTFRDVTHRDDVAREQRYLDALVGGLGDSYSFEKRYVRKDGGTVWASLTISLVRDASEAPAYIIAVVQDVSAQKRAAEVTRRYELLSEQARDIMLFVRERDGAIVEANRAAEEVYGHTREELLRLTIFDLRDEGRSQVVQQQMREASERGVLFETTHKRADGSTFPAEVSSRGAVVLDGERVLLSVVRDVSERRALTEALAKERDALATVMDNTAAQVAYLDAEFRLVLVNDAYVRESGEDREELLGRSVTQGAAPEIAELVDDARRSGRPQQTSAAPFESPHRPERGVTYWDSHLVPVTGDNGTIQGYVLSRTDVTERVRREIYAKGLSDVLERLGESRDPIQLARILAGGIREVLGADSWSVWEFDGHDTWTVRQADRSLAGIRGVEVHPAEAPYAMEAYVTRTVVPVEDCDDAPLGRSRLADATKCRSLMIAPLDLQGQPFSALSFSWHTRDRVFTPAEIDFVQSAAATTSAVMNDARLYQELAERESFAAALNEISAAITSLLDYDQILTRVVRLAAQALTAESGSVSILEYEAWVPRYVYGIPQEFVGVPIPLERVSYANGAVETKQVVAVDDCDIDPRVDPALQRSWGVRAVMVAPLIVRDRAIGAIYFNYHSRPHAFSTGEVDFAGNVAAIISSSLETARLYEAERHVATTLQEAFIHPLPEIPGMEFAVSSQPAYEPALVGGDFSDAFVLADGRVAVLAGDVEGKGVRAAGLTETVRSAVRTLALLDASPAFILDKANELLLRLKADQFVTAALLVVDPATGEAAYASAGHPPALVLSQSSCAELIAGSGTPLGTFELPFEDQHIRLQRDDVVVLYTDGLTEVRHDGEQFGVERAVEAACRLAHGSLNDLVNGLRDAAVAFGGEIRDDMQILAFRLRSLVRAEG